MQHGAAKLVAVPAPIFYAFAFGAGVALQRAISWRPEAGPGIRLAGWLLLIIGVIIGPGSALSFGIKRTTLNPIGQPSRLVTGGAFRLTRNPMYLGLAIAYVGLALMFGRLGPLVLLPLPLVFLNTLVIPFEEDRLRRAFGDAFDAYCRRVRRWL
jgi:protein-S-isoprenylcysteine O-methyltransferase Ste14